MASTQQFIPIKEIKDNLVFLKDGTVNLVLVTSALNFGLLFETEQISIIESFAGLLNSLSFPIQVVILSRKLDVSSYLQTLDQASSLQANLKLKNLTLHYRRFIEGVIKEKNVLDKQFYVCMSVSPLEIGILAKNNNEKSKKAATVLAPRRDHLIRQLARLGIKARQMTTSELIKLFYEIYNPMENGKLLDVRNRKLDTEVGSLKLEEKNPISNIQPQYPSPNFQHQTSTIPSPPQPPPTPPAAPPLSISNLHAPFIVEELPNE